MRSAGAALLCGVLALAACRDRSTVLRVAKILVDSALGSDGVELDKALLREVVGEGLGQMERLRVDPEGTARLRARGVAGRVPPGPSGSPVVLVMLQLEGAEQGTPGHDIEATVERRGQSPVDHPEPLLTAAVQEALASLDRQIALGDRPTKEVIAALATDDRDLRTHAVALLAARRDPLVFDALVGLLDDDDQAIALRAVGAIVALGDPRGVKVLTDLTHRKPAAFVRQIVYAVGAIGGREAQAYLFTVATGHPDAAVQQAAEEALREMSERGDAPRQPQEEQ